MSSVALAYASDTTQAPQTGFSERVSQLLDRIDYRLIDSDDEREAVFRLRYDAYLREGAIGPNASERFADAYDESENCWIFGLYVDDELASSIRLHVASEETPVFPSLSVFSDLLEPELTAGKTIVDPTRFVTDPRLSKLYPGLPHVTLRLCWLAAEYFSAEHFIVAVRAEHQAFYKRTFLHQSICGARPYPLLAKPITLMTVNYRNVADQVHRRYPFFRSTFFERRMMFERYLPIPKIPLQQRPRLHNGAPQRVTAQAS
jgi:N-acyl-L-homoserine lactone synthetase